MDSFIALPIQIYTWMSKPSAAFKDVTAAAILVLMVLLLVQGIAGDKYSLGYFGYSYYVENTDKLTIVKIDNGSGPVEPTFDTIMDGSYAPLSRPI